MIHVAIFVNLFFFSMDRAYRFKVPTEPKVKVKPKAKERHMCTCLMHGASRVGKLASYRPSQTQTHATQAQAQQVDRPTGRTLSLLISWSLPNSSPPHMRNFTVLNKYLEISKFLRYLTLRGTKFYTIKYGTFVYILKNSKIILLLFNSSSSCFFFLLRRLDRLQWQIVEIKVVVLGRLGGGLGHLHGKLLGIPSCCCDWHGWWVQLLGSVTPTMLAAVMGLLIVVYTCTSTCS